MALTSAERTRRYRERKRLAIAEMDPVSCACGCGELIAPMDDHGRPKRLKNGHQPGNEATLRTDGSSWKGRRHSPESRARMSAAKDQGSLSYWALHKWASRHFEKAGTCESCGKEKLTEWAMRDHAVFSRDRDAWLELCKSCHATYDIEHNGKKHGARPRSR